MLRKNSLILTIVAMTAAVVVSLFPAAPAVHAADGPPSYQLQYLGTGAPVAINNTGIVVGSRLNGNNYEPLASVNGAPWTLLPVPAGAMSVFPTDVNDAGVVVGVSYDASWNAVAVRWRPAVSGFTVEILPRLPGDTSSYATGINNLGQIVGARRALGYVPAATTGWLYSDELGAVDLYTRYGWATAPAGINDLSQVIGGTERLTLATGAIENLGAGPANYNPVTLVAINDQGRIAGSAALRSSSLNIVSAFRYEGAAGWTFIAGSSKYTAVSSINNRGDIGYGELGAGLYLDGLGIYPVGSLLDPTVTAVGWAITGSGAKINDQRAVATVARNANTGEAGGVLLTPVGALPPPTAPANLQGMAHPATRMEPYNSINLTWENTSSLTRSYELERREAGAAAWMQLALTPPGTATNHTDTTVGVGVPYEYRVRAVGLGGASPWSNVAVVTSPSTPLDTTPPTVAILSPANGAAVSGRVTVSAQATDNVAVEYLEISFWNQYLGQRVILGSVANAGALAVEWDTNGLTPATYAVSAYAYDTLGNWTQTEISVNVTAAVASLKVSNIALSGTLKGSTANVTGDVHVKDGGGRAAANVNVAVSWTLPGGAMRTATAVTNSAGRARFTVSGGRGTYVLAVTGVTKAGYVFDAAGSILTKSIAVGTVAKRQGVEPSALDGDALALPAEGSPMIFLPAIER
jgi:hypothetical protein